MQKRKAFLFLIGFLLLLVNNTNAGWGNANWPHGISVSSLAVDTLGHLYAATYDSGVFLSTTSGNSWTPINTGLPIYYVYTLAVSGTSLFAGVEGGGVFRSTNNGSNWMAVNNGLPPSTSVFNLTANGSNLFAVANGYGFFRSNDNGNSWTAASFGLPGSMEFHALLGNGTYLFAGTDSGVYISNNNGVNWNTVNTGLTSKYVFALSENSTTLFAGTENGGVFISNNNGASWSAFNTGLSTSPSIYALAANNKNIFAWVDGSGLWMRPLLEVSTIVEDNSIYPVNRSNIIKMSTSRPVSLKGYNALGRRITSISTADALYQNFYPTHLSTGQYFFQLEAGGKMETNRLQVIKLLFQK